MSKKPKLTDNEVKKVCSLYIDDKISACKIAKLYNCGTTTITTYLKKNNIEIRSKSESISKHWVEFKQSAHYEDYITILSNSKKNIPKSKEARKNMSKARAEGISNGTIESRTYGKSKWYKGIYCRSSYEVSFIDICEKYNIRIEPCKFTIPYEFEGNIKYYIPDFISVDNKTIYEVKPMKLKGTEMNQAKARAAHEYCKNIGFTYQFITEVTLFDQKVTREEYAG